MRQFMIGFVCAAALSIGISLATSDERTERSWIREEWEGISDRAISAGKLRTERARQESWTVDRIKKEMQKLEMSENDWEESLLSAQSERAAFVCWREMECASVRWYDLRNLAEEMERAQADVNDSRGDSR